MTVQEAIEILADCDPDAIVCDYDEYELQLIEDLGDKVILKF